MDRFLWLFLISFFVYGCTYTANYETGRPIDESKVYLIKKKQTTESQILSMFGEPTTKIVVNGSDTKWIYQHIISIASSQMYTGRSKSSLNNNVLDILFKDGIVINFTYSKSESNPQMKINHK